MIAEIIAAGSEMLTPFRQDTNSLYLTARLNELGVAVAFKTIVGDNLEDLTGAARITISRADIVVFSGGLGPGHTYPGSVLVDRSGSQLTATPPFTPDTDQPRT